MEQGAGRWRPHPAPRTDHPPLQGDASMPFVITPVIWLVIALACTNAFTGVMWYVNHHDAEMQKARVVSCQEERKFFEEKVRAAGEQAHRRILAEQQKSEQVTREVSHAYQTRLDALRADYERLRKRAAVRASGGGVQSFPVAAASVDEIPTDAVPLAAACAETTLQLTELQGWVSQQKGEP